MKRYIKFFVILSFITQGTAQQRIGSGYLTQSYYGFSGLTFIPSAQVVPSGQFGISYYSKPSSGSEIDLLPYSLKLIYGFFNDNLEIASTNTPYYASNRNYNGVDVSHGVKGFETAIPVYPSLKYQIMPMRKQNYQVGMAIGFAFPYGGYYVVDKHVDLRLADMTIHTGVATKLTTYHAFAGLTFTVGERIAETQRGFNLEMLVEGGWGGSLKQLDQKEEAFLAVSFRYSWTTALYISTFIRFDNQPYFENGGIQETAPTTLMAVGLDFHVF